MNTTQPNHPPGNMDAIILQAFGALTALDAVKNTRYREHHKPILINDVLAYVQGRTTLNTKRVELQLCCDLSVRRQYQQLLKLNCVEHISKPRAAHSENLFDKRIGEQGVSLKLKQSKGDANQFYLIIELPDNLLEHLSVEPGKTLVLHANTLSQTQRLVFPPLHDARTHVIIKKDEPLFALLQDHDVEIDIQ